MLSMMLGHVPECIVALGNSVRMRALTSQTANWWIRLSQVLLVVYVLVQVNVYVMQVAVL